MKAIWNGKIVAESDNTIVVEGNQYFPPDSIKKEYFSETNKHTTCPWKGQASYFDVIVDSQTNRNAAWYYPQPKDAARANKRLRSFLERGRDYQINYMELRIKRKIFINLYI